MALRVVEENPNFVEDTDKGIILPARMTHVQYIPHAFDDVNRHHGQGMSFGVRHIVGVGTVLEHDKDTGVAFWPAYASGLDDFLMRSIVQGYMGNSGMTPVTDTLLSTIVAKIQGMVGTWVNSVRGKKSPVKKTLALMSRANDSPFGSAEFVRDYMGALCVDNRGAIVAQVPIGNIVVDKWPEYGMELEEIAGQRSKSTPNVKPTLYVLRMTTDAFRENQGLYMLDGLTCMPTGDKEYPYWIRKYSKERDTDIWVLVHRDFGFQIIQQVSSPNDMYRGFGQSGTWRYSPYEIKHMAIDQQDWEHLINQPMRGIVWVSGLDTPTQFRDQLIKYREELEDAELKFYPGVFFGGSQGENSKIMMMPWSEPPSGYTPKEWEDLKVSKLAAAFHMNETHLQLKLGEGAMTQSGVADSLEAETAVAWMRHTIEMMWNYVAPPRVSVSVIWQSDRQRRVQIESARELSLALSRLLKVESQPSWENNVFTAEEVRALFTDFIGIEIPRIEEGVVGATDKSGPEDVEDVEEFAHRFVPATEFVERLDMDPAAIFAPGNKVRLISGRIGYITRSWTGSDWIWVQTDRHIEMLVPSDRLSVIEFGNFALSILGIDPGGRIEDMTETELEEAAERGNIIMVGSQPTVKDPLIQPHKYVSGQRVYVGENDTPATVTLITSKGIFVNFDWDDSRIEPRLYAWQKIKPMGFEPASGEPLPFPESVDTDRSEAEDDAQELWQEEGPEGKEDLLKEA